MSNDNIDRTVNMGTAGKALFEALKSQDPMQQIVNLNKLVDRPISALAEDARQASWNEDYAADRFFNFGSE